VRIISESRLKRWFRGRKDRAAAERSLKLWIAIARAAAWSNPADVKATFGARVDFVRSRRGSELAVFDVHGNHCRLVTAIHYLARAPIRGRVYILRVLTHAEYDTNRWREEL
jgi:mRNA interferase HigB